MDFLIEKADLHNCRFDMSPAAELEPGQALLRVDSFGLTSNNITYAMFGQAMSYWDFFPAEEGWGRVPVWGFAEIVDSRTEGLEPGRRFYGYLPPSRELIVTPERIGPSGFIDASPHRSKLPPAYNSYADSAADPVYEAGREDQQMLLRPLFFTSWLIDDFLRESDFFGADTVVLSSASSKTSSALAFLLARDRGSEILGLTSARSAEFARELGVYDDVVSYEDLDALPQGSAVYVDMAGNADLRSTVHDHFAAELKHSAVVGATHHDSMGALPENLPGAHPTFFFAPDRVVKRSTDWGRAGLEQRLAEAWHPYVEWTDSWLKVIHASGPEALESAYLDLLGGRIDPATAHILTLTG